LRSRHDYEKSDGGKRRREWMTVTTYIVAGDDA